jgi:hypothetical protein
MKKIILITVLSVIAIETAIAGITTGTAMSDSGTLSISGTGIFTTQAYIDPGSGSVILQVILAGLLGMLFAIKIYFKWIVTFFKNLFSRKDTHGKS